MRRIAMPVSWSALASLARTAVAVWALAACGGGSGDAGPAIEGSRDSTSISSRSTGTTYPISIYVPPPSAGARGNLPVVYVLDGESWFDTLVGIAESTRTRMVIIGVGTAGQRSRDFVPANLCTANGGGHEAYFQFLRQELIPYVERTVGGDPNRRVLFGHSHGGSFALYALFAESPSQHTFSAYLASDSSISCMPAAAGDWEQGYAAAHRSLPVRLHLSYATAGNYGSNLGYSATIAQRNYAGLAFVGQAYSGTHGGIVPQVLADGMGFALAANR